MHGQLFNVFLSGCDHLVFNKAEGEQHEKLANIIRLRDSNKHSPL